MKKLDFSFWNPVKIHFGKSAMEKLPELVEGDRVQVVMDRFLMASAFVEGLREALAGKELCFFSDIVPNPTTDNVDAGAGMARENRVTTVIGIGGGSSLDVAKAVAYLAGNEGSILDYAGGGRAFGRRSTRLILVPTTAGTGSEVTNVAVFNNPATGDKSPIVNDALYADAAVVDPALSYTMPKNVTANTGMDAFCHAIEAYWNQNSNPASDELGIGAMRLILENLERAFQDPADEEARQNMSLASLLAGLAFSQTRTTGAHVLSYPLGALYHIPHGIGCAISISQFIRLSPERENEKMTRLAKTLGFSGVAAFADHVDRLMRSLEMPVRLREIGAVQADIDGIAETAVTRYAGQLNLSPACMTKEAVVRLLNNIY